MLFGSCGGDVADAWESEDTFFVMLAKLGSTAYRWSCKCCCLYAMLSANTGALLASARIPLVYLAHSDDVESNGNC